MKVTVTALKAPWPAGAFIGAIVAIAAAQLPGCFVGKCTPAPDDAEPGFAWEPAAAVLAPALEDHAAALAQAQADIDAAAARAAEQLQSEQQLRAAAEQSAHEVARMLDAERTKSAGLAAQLAAAEVELGALRAAAGGELVTNPAGDAGAAGRSKKAASAG